MCTVSYFKNKDQVIITSNREEHIQRALAIPPTGITLKNRTVYCPIDPLHKGTWFAVSESGSVFVLLNGAGNKHIPNPPYKKSRGLILLDLIDNEFIEMGWDQIELNQIENFTLIVYQKGKLFQFCWDGVIKSQISLDTEKPQIWSSVTLYDKDTIEKRKEWFKNFLLNKENIITSSALLDFHSKTESKDTKNGLIINRENGMLTKNISQAIIYPNRLIIKHKDLITTNSYLLEHFIS